MTYNLPLVEARTNENDGTGKSALSENEIVRARHMERTALPMIVKKRSEYLPTVFSAPIKRERQRRLAPSGIRENVRRFGTVLKGGHEASSC